MPKKAKDVSPIPPKELDALMDEIWAVYPDRDLPHVFIPARLAIAEQLAAGATPDDLVRAARRYRDHVAREATAPKYVKGMAKFYSEEMWRAFVEVTVYGRTREQWAKSGQDVLEWDRLAAQEENA
jgi:MoxR-like ATPase